MQTGNPAAQLQRERWSHIILDVPHRSKRDNSTTMILIWQSHYKLYTGTRSGEKLERKLDEIPLQSTSSQYKQRCCAFRMCTVYVEHKWQTLWGMMPFYVFINVVADKWAVAACTGLSLGNVGMTYPPMGLDVLG